MGHIHETNSKIFGIEERSESCYLYDLTANEHMIFYHDRPDDIKNTIVAQLKTTAGHHYAHGNEQAAKAKMELAAEVSQIKLPETGVHSVEVTHAWLRDLYLFLKNNPQFLAAIGIPCEKTC